MTCSYLINDAAYSSLKNRTFTDNSHKTKNATQVVCLPPYPDYKGIALPFQRAKWLRKNKILYSRLAGTTVVVHETSMVWCSITLLSICFAHRNIGKINQTVNSIYEGSSFRLTNKCL